MAGTLFRDAALADGTGPQLRLGVSVLVESDRIRWIRSVDDEPDAGPGVEVVDASGCTIVPGLVDSHSHLTLPGGAHWIDRAFDDPDRLVAVAEHNARLLRSAGVRWARDVGSPTCTDPVDGRVRALALGVRDRWAGSREHPYVRAAGSWVVRAGSLPPGLAVEVDDGADLVAAVTRQLDDGADLVKLYLDGPDRETAPFTVEEVRAVVDTAHRRGARVAAHSGLLPPAVQFALTNVTRSVFGPAPAMGTSKTTPGPAATRRVTRRAPLAGTLDADHPLVRFLLERGWEWGGTWAVPDYQHFQLPGLPARMDGATGL